MIRRRALPWFVLIGLFLGVIGYVLAVLPQREAAGTRPAAGSAGHRDGLDDGLSETHDGFTLRPVTLPAARGDAVPLAFRVVGGDGRPAGYAPLQGKPLHLYVVREDMQHYQHLHPELAGETWTASVRVPDGGVYRAYAEFLPADRADLGHPTVLATRFVIAGDTRPAAIAAPAARAVADGFTVRRLDGVAPLPADRPAAVRFQVLDRAGRPVPGLQPYLGAYAHVSAFDVFTQAITHLHPLATTAGPPPDGTLTFHARFAQRGEKRLFLQFQAGGVVRQVAFTLVVD